MRYPVDTVRLSSGFGVYRRAQGRVHWGVDLHAPRGTEVLAPEDMRVLYVWSDDATPPWVGYGPGGVLARGTSTPGEHYHLLAHLEPGELPAVGDELQEGALVGRTSSLNHVHWEIRRVPIDSPATRGTTTFDPTVWVRTGGLIGRSSSGIVLLALLLLISARRL